DGRAAVQQARRRPPDVSGTRAGRRTRRRQGCRGADRRAAELRDLIGKLIALPLVGSGVPWVVLLKWQGCSKQQRQGAERFRLRASNQGKRAGAGKRPP